MTQIQNPLRLCHENQTWHSLVILVKKMVYYFIKIATKVFISDIHYIYWFVVVRHAKVFTNAIIKSWNRFFFNFQDNYEKCLVTTETKSNSRCVFFVIQRRSNYSIPFLCNRNRIELFAWNCERLDLNQNIKVNHRYKVPSVVPHYCNFIVQSERNTELYC